MAKSNTKYQKYLPFLYMLEQLKDPISISFHNPPSVWEQCFLSSNFTDTLFHNKLPLDPDMQTLIWVKLFKTGKNYPSSIPPVTANHPQSDETSGGWNWAEAVEIFLTQNWFWWKISRSSKYLESHPKFKQSLSFYCT